MKKHTYLSIIFFLFSWINTQAQTAGDSIHVDRYEIAIDTLNFSSSSFKARTSVSLHARVNSLNCISLMLLHLQVDSIVCQAQTLAYSYNDTTLRITPSSILSQNDSLTLTVYYQGQPVIDPSGWGGFYFSGNFAYNLGVGFDDTPHNYGRAWFPCIDEFTDKSFYKFHITTPATFKAFCNGILTDSIDNGNGTVTWSWSMNQPIPSYLASMAVAPYYTIHRNYSSIPFSLACLPADTISAIGSFAHIDTAIATFINRFGPYPFDKVGFVLTQPFVYGGMEHASSIHISKAFVDGSLSYETLFAHELSHMWWGDNATCVNEGNMWLNEGFATFCESIFTEALYGETAYKTSFRNNHHKVLQFSHIEDGGYQTLNTVPHTYTYANLSVYAKGALTAHTLRKYMGDSAFFQACRFYHAQHAFGNASSQDFRDAMATSSGQNLNDFFDDWVLTPGFPHFSIDSTTIEAVGNAYQVHVWTKQKRKGATHVSKMLVELNFTNGIQDTSITVLCDAPTNSFALMLPFEPTWIAIDRNEKMMDAIADFELPITTTGTKYFLETNVTCNVQNSGSGDNILRVEHHFVAPDDFKFNPGIRISDYHYWSVDGLISPNFRTKATFSYDGSTNGSSGYLDNTLITAKEDSLVLLYRTSAANDWQKETALVHNPGSLTDKRGNFIVDSLKKGEYCLGYLDYRVQGINCKNKPAKAQLAVFPNPANNRIHIRFDLDGGEKAWMQLTDPLGKIANRMEVFAHQQEVSIDTFGLPAGLYYLTLLPLNGLPITQAVVVFK